MDNTQNPIDSADDILQAALTQAFLVPLAGPSASADPGSSSTEATINATQTDSAPNVPSTTLEPQPSDDSWKSDYEAQVAAWRAQSSEAREKAEKERQRWEEFRAAEQEEAVRHAAASGADEPSHEHSQQDADWETVSNAHSNPIVITEVTPEDTPEAAKSLPSGPSRPQQDANIPGINIKVSASSHKARANVPTDLPGSHSSQLRDDLQKWDSIPPSMASSLPSMSFPEHIDTPSPARPPPAESSTQFNLTFAVFDSTLSTRTRVNSLFASLAINLLLPFINGVMLGFGEIFAKNVVLGWFGWKPHGPGSIAGSAGINANPRTPGSRRSWIPTLNRV